MKKEVKEIIINYYNDMMQNLNVAITKKQHATEIYSNIYETSIRNNELVPDKAVIEYKEKLRNYNRTITELTDKFYGFCYSLFKLDNIDFSENEILTKIYVDIRFSCETYKQVDLNKLLVADDESIIDISQCINSVKEIFDTDISVLEREISNNMLINLEKYLIEKVTENYDNVQNQKACYKDVCTYIFFECNGYIGSYFDNGTIVFDVYEQLRELIKENIVHDIHDKKIDINAFKIDLRRILKMKGDE